MRWILLLIEQTFDVVNKKRRFHTNADALFELEFLEHTTAPLDEKLFTSPDDLTMERVQVPRLSALNIFNYIPLILEDLPDPSLVPINTAEVIKGLQNDLSMRHTHKGKYLQGSGLFKNRKNNNILGGLLEQSYRFTQGSSDKSITPVPLNQTIRTSWWQPTDPFSAPMILLAVLIRHLICDRTKFRHLCRVNPRRHNKLLKTFPTFILLKGFYHGHTSGTRDNPTKKGSPCYIGPFFKTCLYGSAKGYHSWVCVKSVCNQLDHGLWPATRTPVW